MRYSDDTFQLYAGLFEEAHACVKTAGAVLDRALSWTAKKISPKSVARAEEMAAQAARHEAASKGMAEMYEGSQYELALARREAEQHAKELSALGADPGALTAANQQAEAAQQAASRARSGRNTALGVGAAGLGVGVPVAYMAGRNQGDADKTRTRNLAFGAGAAAGIALPSVVRGLGNIARGAGQSGAFPELADAVGGYDSSPGYGY